MADGLVVRGGAGGTTAWLDDLDRAAVELARRGAELARLAAATGALARDGALVVSIVVSPGTGLHAEAEILAAVVGPHGLVACAARLELLAGGVRSAVTAYRATDDAVAGTLHALDLAAGRVASGLLGAGLVTVATLAGPSILATLASGGGHLDVGWAAGQGVRLLALLARHPMLTEHLVDAAPGAIGALLPTSTVLGAGWLMPPLGPSDPGQASRLISRLGSVSPWLRESPQVRVTVGPSTPSTAPTGVEDLLRRVGTNSPGVQRPDGTVAPPGTVRVERVVAPDGTRRWVVEIPGTHVWAPSAGADPFDLTSDVRTLGGRTSAVQRTVEQALDAAGARPDEPVLLVGHSLGGMVAAGMAADPVVRQRFRITDVVTAGSPVAFADVPPDIHVLSLEHTDDLVPRLDGRPNPDAPNRVTVSRPSTPAGGEDAQARLVHTHDIRAYLLTGAMVDADTDPGLVAARQRLAPFLDAPGRTATSWDVQGIRVVPDPVGSHG